MSQTISWKFQAQVPGGPSLALAHTLSADAYEQTRVVIGAGADDQVVNLAAGAILLVVSASSYADNDATHILTFKINNTPDDHNFTPALVLVGELAVSRFAGAALTSLSFTNPFATPVTIDILTARDATP